MENFQYTLILLACAISVVVMFRRINLPPILGYLFVGMAVGPGGLDWVPITEKMHFLAEFGVVFLMFTIGLEFSLPRLMAMKRTLLGLGGVQVVICTIAASAIGVVCGLPPKTAFIAAGALALSSTAVVIKQLTEQRELHTLHGSLSLSILLFQDLAAVLFLILLGPLAGGAHNSSVMMPILWSLTKGAFVFISLATMGLWLLRPLFHEVAKSHSTELFMLAALFVVLGAAWVTNYLELSMALGAFLAGLMLGETEFRHQIEIDIRPFRDVLLGFFFITVGALLNVRELPEHGLLVLFLLLTLVIVKSSLIMALTYVVGGIKPAKAFRTGLILAQGGEFGFVILTEAIRGKLIDPVQSQIVIATTVLSIVLAPILIRYNKYLSELLFGLPEPSQNKDAQPYQLAQHTAELKDHVIICGFGRVGQVLARFLEQEDIPSVALDLDPMRITKSTLAGENTFYGDARNPQVLAAAGLARARMLVISFSDEEAALATLKHVRALRLDLPVFVRTRDDTNLSVFQESGATEVVPESLEASLMLASHLLMTLGISPAKILSKVRAVHADRYRVLQGFFKGMEDTTMLEDDESSRMELHTVSITEKAFAVGKSVQAILMDNEAFHIKSITRGDTRYLDPEPDFIIEENDILIIYATPENIYLLEKRILRGD